MTPVPSGAPDATGRPRAARSVGDPDEKRRAAAGQEPGDQHGVQVRVDDPSATHLAARTARTLAAACGLPGPLPDQAATVASELASNLDKHARDGVLYLQPLLSGGGLEIVAADAGPGMPDVDRCLADGFTTTGTLGAGLGAVDRMASGFTVRSEPGHATYAAARFTSPGEERPGWRHAARLCLPADGETACGDTCDLVDAEDGRTVMVVDGLGHGAAAAEAAAAALRVFRAAASDPLPRLMASLDRGLRRTRGAAVGLLRLPLPGAGGQEHVEYCGVGNVSTAVCTYDGVRQRLRSQPGIVGWNLPAPLVQRADLPPGATVLLHTDGVGIGWAHSPGRFLLGLPPSLLAAALMHRFRLARDDATIVAVRNTPTYHRR